MDNRGINQAGEQPVPSNTDFSKCLILKIKMLCNVCCLKARLRLLCKIYQWQMKAAMLGMLGGGENIYDWLLMMKLLSLLSLHKEMTKRIPVRGRALQLEHRLLNHL